MLSSSPIHFQNVACAFSLKMLPFLEFRNQIPHVIPISMEHSPLPFLHYTSGLHMALLFYLSLSNHNIYTENQGIILQFSCTLLPTHTEFHQHGVWHTRDTSENSMHWTPRWRETNSYSKSDFHKAVSNRTQSLQYQVRGECRVSMRQKCVFFKVLKLDCFLASKTLFHIISSEGSAKGRAEAASRRCSSKKSSS